VAILVALVGGLLAVVWVIDWIIGMTTRRSGSVAVLAVMLLSVASCKSSSPTASEIEKPVVISRTEPSYPEALKNAGVSGLVPLEAIIGTDGVPRDVRIIEHEATTTNQELQRIAIETLSAWRFRPAMKGGKPVEHRYVTSIYFKLSDN
jgi:TonB family protein